MAAAIAATEVIPRAPVLHFNDYALLVRRETAEQLNAELAQFERDTSNQIVVAIFPRMQSASSVEDYAVRVAQAWGVGQRDRKNGAVLFVFKETRDIRIVTGYGLEGALPDALCKQIIENEIAPRFRAGDFDGGIAAGVHAMMAATRGEYRGTGRTNASSAVAGRNGGRSGSSLVFIILFIAFMLITRRFARRRGTLYGRGGRRGIWLGGPPFGGGLGGGRLGGGGSVGGGSWNSGGGGGTFSGGGGSFGGGGAGGKW